MEQPLAFSLDIPLRGRLQALHGQLRAAILDGRLRTGHPLPSTRTLATSLGLSRNTIVAAYDRLLSEGYIVSRQGAGYVVAHAGPTQASPSRSSAGEEKRLQPQWRGAMFPAPMNALPPARYDLRVGLPDASRFPFEAWRKLSARALRALSRAPSFYGAVMGREALREAIAGHVSFTRAVTCSAADIMVTAGAQQAFDLLARILVTPGRTVVAVEDPGYPPLRQAFETAGAQVVPVPVDNEGLVVEQIPHHARVIYVTPSHQFPSGMAMSPARRVALLEFARRHEAVIIEDDYDGEFRYGQRPIDALQSIDTEGRVIYVGTFSKALSPQLRLGYLVLPHSLVPVFRQAKRLADRHAPALEQQVLAALIGDGAYERHVRRMRRENERRRSTLLQAIERYLPGNARVDGTAAGLHVVLWLPSLKAHDEPALAAAARGNGVGIYPVSPLFAPTASRGRVRPAGFILGYASLTIAQIQEGMRLLGKAIAQ